MAAARQSDSDTREYKYSSSSDDNIAEVATYLGQLSMQPYWDDPPAELLVTHSKGVEKEQVLAECEVDQVDYEHIDNWFDSA